VQVKVSVNVVRAFEVPVRKDTEPAPGDGANAPTFVPVRPFVEASFQGAVARTTAADGANPTWNQDLQLPLRYPPCP
jgi:coiled-coil and C2 domain-containing protein 2A